MERLQPRNEKQETGVAGLAKKLMKLAFWSFVVAMGLVGLWFTVTWSIPQEMLVEHTQEAAWYQQDQQGSVKVYGTYAHYALGNQPDVFQGSVTVDDRRLELTLEFPAGQTFAYYKTGGKDGVSLLLSRDQKTILFQDAAGELLFSPNTQEALQSLRAALTENPDWAQDFRLLAEE